MRGKTSRQRPPRTRIALVILAVWTGLSALCLQAGAPWLGTALFLHGAGLAAGYLFGLGSPAWREPEVDEYPCRFTSPEYAWHPDTVFHGDRARVRLDRRYRVSDAIGDVSDPLSDDSMTSLPEIPGEGKGFP